MPTTTCRINVRRARKLIVDGSLTAPRATGRVGLESEWHVVVGGSPTAVAQLDLLDAAVAQVGLLPGGSAVTYEPGGQLELSGPAHSGVEAAVAAMKGDLAAVEGVLSTHGLELVGSGIDAMRPAARLLQAPRYDAMEDYFDGHGPHGRTMMTRTASIQVNLDAGAGSEFVDRWQLVHALGPTLVAAFANSPIVAGTATGWRSTRLANWWMMDASRTSPVGPQPEDWVDYVLDARVMLVRVASDRFVPVHDGTTMRAWIEHGHTLGWPTSDDLAYHLTTLFPPVRPRGWLEIRYLDALPMAWWPVAAAVTATLVDDPSAAATATEATAATAGRWLTAARHGLSDDALAGSARRCFAAAIDALDRRGVSPALVERCVAYADRFVARRRCPADDVLDAATCTAPCRPVTGVGIEEPSWI